MTNEKLYTNGNLCCIVILSLIIRCSVSLHSYSGEKTPPMFGDYEAQRHWMELTVNLFPEEWYLNSSQNDLMYWGLDYPPLTAYHSYINGKVAKYINPEYIKLNSSRGYESYNHKFFMRMTVVVADLFIYFSSVTCFLNSIYKSNQTYSEFKHGELSHTSKQRNLNLRSFNTTVTYLVQIAIPLLYPGLILIDHGHFQYNSVSLGFTVGAITALINDKFLLSSFLFCLALNYKQMSLYHSLPFFIYILSHCVGFKKPFKIKDCILKLSSVSLTVIFTFGVIWFPFLFQQSTLIQVVKRLFPLSRGIFEDKVSNIWCSINVIYKINKIMSHIVMVKICAVSVLAVSIIPLVNLFRYPSCLRFLLSLINVSLNFFLLSYQVHEKSILLVALPVLLFFPFDPFPCFWFLMISNFSMLPLLQKDNLITPFLSLNCIFALFVFANVNFHSHLEKKVSEGESKFCLEKRFMTYVYFAFKLSLSGCILIFLCSIFVHPPLKYPDIWPLLISIYSCFHFCLFAIYFNYIQIYKTLD